MSVYVHNGSTWVTVPNGTAIRVHNGTTWTTAKGVYVHNGTTWQQAWSQSDPLTVASNVAGAETFRRSAGGTMSWNPAGDAGYAYIGRTSGSYDNVGCFNVTNGLYALAMGDRQTVTSASFTLKRGPSSGSSSISGTVYLGLYTGVFNSGTPLYTNLDFTPSGSKVLSSVGFDDVITFDLGTTFGQTVNDAIRADGSVVLAFSVRTSGWDATGSADGLYSKWRGPSTAYTGSLSITCDY
jgi:hypothetical protein